MSRFVWILAAGAVLVGPIVLASPFGINAHIPWAEVLDEAVGVGIDWVRIDFRWVLVELEQDDFDWSIYDRLLDETEARGLRVFATIGETPAWATSGEPGVGPPDDPADWHDVCFRAAARYRGRVSAWGLWNEPNLEHFWSGTRQQYIEEILLVGAEAIRAADSGALVCGPGLAHLSSFHWEDWLRDVIRQGAGVLDVVTHHVYPDGASHSSVTNDLDRGGSYPWDPPSVREVLQDEGWFGRPFWLTETGVNADDHGERSQASFYTTLLLDWFRPDRDMWWVDRMFFYQLADDPRFPEHAWGIFGPPPELTPRQAVTAYRAFINSAEVDDAEIGPIEVPAFVEPGGAAEGKIAVLNTGTTDWTPEGGYVLGDPSGEDVWPLPAGTVVGPGETWTFGVSISPGEEGTAPWSLYPQWRMLRLDRWWFGDLRSETIVVTSQAPPVVVVQPSSSGAFGGGTARFQVRVFGSGPVTFEWQRNGLPIGADPRFEGGDSPQLTVLQVDRHVTGEFRCLISNPAGSVASSPAELVLYSPSRRHPMLEDAVVGAVGLPDSYSPWRYGSVRD